MPMFMGDTDCSNKAYTPESILNHLKGHSKSSSFYYGALRYLQILYYDTKLKLRPCKFPVEDPPSSPSNEITTANTPSSPQSKLNITANLVNIRNDNEIPSPAKIKISILEQIKQLPTCPITLDDIEDPVINSDSFTYERCTIQRWMCEAQTSNPKSPMTKELLVFTELRDNLIIKSLLLMYHDEMNKKLAAEPIQESRTETIIFPTVSSSQLVCTIDMIMETEPEATASSMIIDMDIRKSSNPQVISPQKKSAPLLPEMDHSSAVIHDNTSIELPAAHVPFLQDSSVGHASRYSPFIVDSTVGHASRHLPVRVESPSSHASRQPSGSLISGVTHASQEPYIAPIDNISSTPPPTFASQHERKQQQQKANIKIKKKILNKMKAHHKYLKDDGWLEDNENLRQNLPTKPSYSMMHSLEQGFQIGRYSCTHSTRADGQLIIHKNHATILILAPGMTVIWDKATLYSASKSKIMSWMTLLYTQKKICTYLCIHGILMK